MPLREILSAQLSLAVEMFSSGVIMYACMKSFFLLGRDASGLRSRQSLAQGIVWALSFKTAAALLKMISLVNWQQIGMFVSILSLRILLKFLFTWEEKRMYHA